jgi:aldehyde dehydrogenase (NAD+)
MSDQGSVRGSLVQQLGVDEAVDAGRAAFAAWSTAPPQARSNVLLRWANLLLEHREYLAQLASSEMGKLLRESRGEVDRAVEEIQFCAGEAHRVNGESYPSSVPGTTVFSALAPVGLVAAITPWNFPVLAPSRKLAPALAMGNCVVLKPSEESPRSALALCSLLVEAGLPENVVTVTVGAGPTGAALVAHPYVRAISFTGSTSVGRSIAEAAARRLVPVQLELGGKNAAYVHRSADLDKAVPQLVSAAMQSSGQRCTAISRVIVDDAVADELVRRLAEAFDALRLGPGSDDTTDIGPLVSQQQKTRVDSYLAAADREGAVIATARSELPEGNFVAPTVLDRVLPDMTVAREEIFGPVISVVRVADLAEAIDVVNASDYGLAGAVFAAHVDVVMEFIDRVEVGMVHVNHGTSSQAHVPFGGVGVSGLGTYSIGHDQLEFFTTKKVVYLRAP